MSGNLADAASKLASTFKIHVLPAHPARLATPDGQEIVFNCGPDAKRMFIEIPEGLKYAGQ